MSIESDLTVSVGVLVPDATTLSVFATVMPVIEVCVVNRILTYPSLLFSL